MVLDCLIISDIGDTTGNKRLGRLQGLGYYEMTSIGAFVVKSSKSSSLCGMSSKIGDRSLWLLKRRKRHTEPVEPPKVCMHYAAEFCMPLSVMFHLAVPSMYTAIQNLVYSGVNECIMSLMTTRTTRNEPRCQSHRRMFYNGAKLESSIPE